ncbi:MAG TPA: hypothetical protein VFC47_10740 [Caulobacteraceae bacterium]|nr:hypothetical protein [Caulobacteraceae bacterium]
MLVRAATLVAMVLAASLWNVSSATAQELWNGARLGMTPAEVEATFPQAAHGQWMVSGDDTRLRVGALRAGGHDATAFFEFRGERLSAVELELAPGAGGGPIDTAGITRQMSAKYGPPTDCDQGEGKCEWRAGEVDMTLIHTRDPAERVEILYDVFGALRAPAAGRAMTPLAVVQAFYGALAAGDGERASRLVVPGKRLGGPLSAEALTGFYSTLAEPIRLTAAWPHSGGSVAVRYLFTAAGGRFCDGAADVRTVWADDQLLIEAIHAYSGC